MDPGSRPRLSAVSAACGLRGTVSSCGFTGLRPAPPAPRVSYRPSPARGPPSLSGLRRWKDSDGGVGRVERGRLRRESTAGSGERPASIGRGWAGSARDPPPLWELLGGYLGCPGQSGRAAAGPERPDWTAARSWAALAIVPERKAWSRPGFSKDERWPGSAAGCKSPRRKLAWAPRRPAGCQPPPPLEEAQAVTLVRNDSTLPHGTANAFQRKIRVSGQIHLSSSSPANL